MHRDSPFTPSFNPQMPEEDYRLLCVQLNKQTPSTLRLISARQ